MKNLLNAIRTSRTLDDARGRARWKAPAAQARVDEALSDPRSVPWENAPRQLHDRIIESIESSTASGSPMEFSSARRAWPRMAIAAGLLLACGVGVIVGLRTPPTPTPTRTAAPVAADHAAQHPPLLAINAETLVSFPRSAEVMSTAGQPMLHEAAAIGQDTRRAISGVFSVIPVRFGSNQ